MLLPTHTSFPTFIWPPTPTPPPCGHHSHPITAATPQFKRLFYKIQNVRPFGLFFTCSCHDFAHLSTECQLTSVCVTGRKIVMRPTWRRREFWIRLTYLSPLEVLWRSWSSINMPVPNFHLLFVQSTNISLSSSKSTGIHGPCQVYIQ